MSRKDYVRIAAALKLAGTTNPSTAHKLALYDAARILAETLAQDNARFDRERFLSACGVQS